MTTPTQVTADGHGPGPGHGHGHGHGQRVVVAAAIEHRGRLLAARRTRPAAIAGRWELPGGKVEPGEDPTQALIRELREELAVDVDVVGQIPGPLEGDWPLDGLFVLRVYRVRLREGSPAPGVDHDELQWLAPHEVSSVSWLDADVEPARAAMQRIDTWVDFPAGAVLGSGTVRWVGPLDDGRLGVIVDRTPFHPLDHGWPDQPGDIGLLGGRRVLDSLTATIDDGGLVQVGADIAVRRGDPTRTWAVAHVLPAGSSVSVGEGVELVVDGESRNALSRGHSACHLAALALNQATAGFWSKEPPRRDSRGFPFLDQIAILESRIRPNGASDSYRCGKSLRKAGFDSDLFLADLTGVTDQVNALLTAWVAQGAASWIDTGGDPTLASKRTWICAVAGGPAVIPCGGTHVSALGELGEVRVSIMATDAGFEVITTVG